jgi:ADP-ribose pyrophosphatase
MDEHAAGLGEAPPIDVEVVRDRTRETPPDEGFLRLRRLVLRNRRPDGTHGPEYRYDLVERDAIDAVVIVLYARTPEVRVCLRSALRPPLAFRPGYAVPLREPAPRPMQWEVPAGLIEPDEHGVEGIAACAARETLEETGLVVPAAAFAPRGAPGPLSPGVLAEKLHYVAAEVDAGAALALAERPHEGEGDGSPVEADAVVRFIALADALALVRAGRLPDTKTEVAIRRLADRLEGLLP